MKESKVRFTHEGIGIDASYIYLEDRESRWVKSSIRIKVPDLQCELGLDVNEQGKLMGIEIIGGDIIPDDLQEELKRE